MRTLSTREGRADRFAGRLSNRLSNPPADIVPPHMAAGFCGRSERQRMEPAEGSGQLLMTSVPQPLIPHPLIPPPLISHSSTPQPLIHSPSHSVSHSTPQPLTHSPSHPVSHSTPQPLNISASQPVTCWLIFDGPEENSYRSGAYRVTYTGGTGPHRADRLILDYVHAAKLLGLDTSRITVETADRALAKKAAAFGAEVKGPDRTGGCAPSGSDASGGG